MRVTALVPAFNEAARVAATIGALRGTGLVERIVVVDDGSTDDTARIAAAAGAEVISTQPNRGKGAALDTGYDVAGRDADVLLLIDADLGDSAIEARSLLEPVLAGDADMTIARFPRPAGKAGFGLVMRLARTGIRYLGGEFDARAPLSGQRALTRGAAAAITPFAFGYGVEVALTIRALRAGLRLLEVETTMTHAATGRNAAGFAHRGRQFVHVAVALFRLAFERRRSA